MRTSIICLPSALLIASLLFTTVLGQDFVLECIQNREDFNNSDWKVSAGNLQWAWSNEELPEQFQQKLVGQDQDVFYFDLSTATENPTIRNDFSVVRAGGPAYIYIKYYAHVSTVSTRFYVLPDHETYYHILEGATDFGWREDLVEIYPSEVAEIGADPVPAEGNVFFIDTIIFAQGRKISNVAEMKWLCEGGDLITSQPTTASTAVVTVTTTSVTDGITFTPSTTAPGVTGSTPMIITSFSPTPEGTSTPAPTNPSSECINYKDDFDSNNWHSYPYHEYSADSADLPADLQDKLNATGIFYLEGSSEFKHQILFKDYHESEDWSRVSTYLYLKYYAVTSSNNSQAVYASPAYVPSDDLIRKLPLGSGFKWEETFLRIDGTIDGMKTVEFGVENFQAREYLLVDKFAVVRANNYVEVLNLVKSCARQ